MITDHCSFAIRLIDWQRTHGRHDLPWQNTRDPYRIWLSEIMLQQTQVAAVIPYYTRFLQRFPTVHVLAEAAEQDVLAHWSGLGYYARGRNVHRAARLLVDCYNGVFPREFEAVCELPGVGRSTAAAICVFAYGARHAILDGNVKRVLARHRGISRYPGETAVQNRLWQEAESLLPQGDVEAFTQGLMDLGARVCVRHAPRCQLCPLREDCTAHANGTVADLPSPRPRKPLRQRCTTFLLLRSGDQVLLETRPAPGIWGGLLCFPETQSDRPVEAAVQFGVQVEQAWTLPPMEHVFTHFQLRISPVLMQVKNIGARACEPGTMWLTLSDALNAAIPTPVRKLLQQLNGPAGPSA